MLRTVRLVDQWRAIEGGLPDDWADARLLLRLEDDSRADRAAAILAPVAPGQHGGDLRFYCARRGAGPSPEHVRRALQRLDRERIGGELELVTSGSAERAVETSRPTLVAAWDAALAGLPAEWNSIYAEIELRSTDYLERTALLLAPANPARYGGRPGFRFRCARVTGYGASAAMVRRCLERLDENDIRGELRVLRVLAEDDHVATQGPVWYVGGRAV